MKTAAVLTLAAFMAFQALSAATPAAQAMADRHATIEAAAK